MRKLSLTRKTVLLISTLLVGFAANAQQSTTQILDIEKRIMSDTRVKSVIISKERETPQLITLKTNGSYSGDQALPLLNNFLDLRQGVDVLKVEKRSRVHDNFEVIEFQQYYQNIKVDRARYKALVKNNSIQFYNGAFYKMAPGVATQPKLSKGKALELAKATVNASKYAYEELQEAIANTPDGNLKKALQAELADADTKGELVFVQDFTQKKKAEVRLAYKFDIYATQPLSRSWVYVDAQTGKILLTDAIIKHFEKDAPPTALSTSTNVQTRYAGLRNIYVKKISGNDPQNGLLLNSSHPTTEVYVPGSATWVLMDDTRGGGIETYDLNGVGGLPVSVPPAYTVAKSFTDVDNNWTTAEHKRGVEDGPGEAENDDIAWDAHWGAEIVYDYWKNKHNRLSYDGKNTKIKSFIHSGLAYDNAFWNGSVMTYGDGSGTTAAGFKPLTSLDVCGHEIGHGVCSSTSDLVYANEFGAMNEALSDIWASCIEFYAITHVDASLKNIYKPFYIGEQISADPNAPLRRMDKPKAAGNPDTYGGENWTDQDGCTPTLVNDECGVHNNSGVLNKWFYLLAVGSGAGSGPDRAYAGEDDEINDAVTTGPVEMQHPANTYSVKGVGFNQAEKLTFLMETMLSSAATYAEAREVSIAAAIQMSGNPCSQLVETVTNAWYAVGVGEAFAPCTTTYGFVSNGVSATTEAATPAGCNSFKEISLPVILPAGGTAIVTFSGSATKGADYKPSTTVMTNKTGKTQRKSLRLTIFNDGYVEGDETIQINLSITKTGSNPVNNTYTVTILDDDVVPVIGSGTKTLLSETFTRADGFADPAGWTEILELPETPDGDPTASGKNQWGIFGNTLAITGKEGTTGATLPAKTYNDNSASQTIIKSPMIDARGLSVVRIAFDYMVQGEVDPTGTDIENFPAFDYMAVAYSLDGVHFVELTTEQFRQFASPAPTSGSVNAILPAALANKQFYLAFRWSNDTNAGGPFSVSIDNLVLTGELRKIESDLNNNGSEIVGGGKDAYFYSSQDGDVLGMINYTSTDNFGCTNLSVEKTGTGAFTLYQSGGKNNKVSDKVIRATATSERASLHTLTLYYTDAELAGIEAATNKDRSALDVYQVEAVGYASATAGNTYKYGSPVYTAMPGIGAMYTIRGREVLTGSYTIGAAVSTAQRAPIVKVQEPAGQWKVDNIYPNPGFTTAQLSLTAPFNQKVRVDFVNVFGQVIQSKTFTLTIGSTNVQFNTASLAAGSYMVFVKDEKGADHQHPEIHTEIISSC